MPLLMQYRRDMACAGIPPAGIEPAAKRFGIGIRAAGGFM